MGDFGRGYTDIVPYNILKRTMHRLYIQTLTFCFVVLFSTMLQARDYYSSVNNGFCGFKNAELQNGTMKITNITDTMAVSLFSGDISVYRYKVVVRLANLHNQENKSYEVISQNGKNKKVKNTEWGLVINYTSSLDYYAIVLQCSNTSPHDMLDKRKMTCSLVHFEEGNRKNIVTKELDKDVDLYTGDNLMIAEYTNNHIAVQIGSKNARKVFSVPLMQEKDVKVGVYCGPGSDVRVERFIVKQKEDPIAKVQTEWTEEKLEKHLTQSTDANEGYWKYLDRDIDENSLRLGGRYTIALVATNSGYDILYIDGADVLSDKWKKCLLKGRLIKTNFQDHYDLVWYDASFAPFYYDVSASIDGGNIMTLYFPIQNSQLRFFKNK